MIRTVFLPLIVIGMTAFAVVIEPTVGVAQQRENEKDKKAKEKSRSAPVKKQDPVISHLPGITDDARCQSEIAVAAFKRLGALTILIYMPSDLANAAAAGNTATFGFCAQNSKVCSEAANRLVSKVGEVPPSCDR